MPQFSVLRDHRAGLTEERNMIDFELEALLRSKWKMP